MVVHLADPVTVWRPGSRRESSGGHGGTESLTARR